MLADACGGQGGRGKQVSRGAGAGHRWLIVRLPCDYQGLTEMLAGLHFLAFAVLVLGRAVRALVKRA